MLVYEETDDGFFVGFGSTQSRKFILIDAHDHETSEVYLIDADAPTAPRAWSQPRQHGHEYAVEHHGDRLIITTNSAGAEDFRICEAPLGDPGQANWRELIAARAGPPHPRDRRVFRDHLVRLEREDGLPRIIVRRLADGAEHAIAFDEEAYALGMSGGYEYDTTTAALRLPVADHAAADLRLRHGDPRADAAQDARRSRPATTRPTT